MRTTTTAAPHASPIDACGAGGEGPGRPRERGHAKRVTRAAVVAVPAARAWPTLATQRRPLPFEPWRARRGLAGDVLTVVKKLHVA